MQNLRTNNEDFLKKLSDAIKVQISTAPKVTNLLYSFISTNTKIPLVNISKVESSETGIKVTAKLLSDDGYIMAGA